jgi:two-component system, OmpR family, lantibiotic biosynthesis response regulator NisR/SpaR
MSKPDRSAQVLMIEDDLSLVGIVVRYLRLRGHDARAAASVEEATEMLRSGFRPTVVLLDINLPGASGWSLLRGPELAAAGSPPVYVVSATSIPSARLREFNVAGFLPKPFALPTLVEMVERGGLNDERAASAAPGGGLDAL